MFFFLCVCECSLTSAKSVQPDLFKVSANEANIKGERKHPLWGAKPLLRPWNAIRLQSSTRSLWFEASVTALETFRAVLYSAYILIIPRSRYFSLPCINQRLELTDDGFSAMAESQLLPFFIRRPWPKCIFSHFVAFGRGRNAVFAVFHSSAVAESRFSAFSAFRRPPTDCFHCFSRFVGQRRTVFIVFRSSLASETLFFAFSAFRLRVTNSFQHFPFFRGEGNTACGIFRFSQT